MRRQFLILAAILLTATAFVLVSCKKDNQKESKNETASFDEASSQENMDAYLLSFKNKLLNTIKDGETTSIEQAEKDLSNLLNFDFGDANYATNILQHDTLSFSLQTQGELVSLANLAEVYQDMVPKILKTYQSATLPDKSVYYIHCDFIETSGKDATDMVDVETVVVIRGYSDNNDKAGNENLDDWRPQNSGGTCEGLLVGSCGAPEILKGRLDYNIGNWACMNGRVYFTENACSYIDYHASNMYDYTNQMYRLYVSWVRDQNEVCLLSDTIQYYYDQARLLPTNYFNNATDFNPSIPNDHVVIEYWIRHRDSDCDDDTITLPWYWELIVEHAKLNCTGSGTIPIGDL